MHILITGGRGQLGTELTKCLKTGKTALGTVPELLEDCSVTSIDFEELDITDRVSIDNYFSSEQIDCVINCAAMTNVDGCETKKDDAFAVNALGCRNLAIACEREGAELISISSDYVFSGERKNGKPYREYDVCNPKSVYGRSKLLGEQYIRDFCSKWYIIRTSWLYGEVGNNFVKTIRRVGAENGKLSVVNDQIGNPTNAADLAHHILKLIGTREYGIYHCTGEGECSWFDFAKKIIELSKINCTVTPCTSSEYPSSVKRPAYSSLENMALRLSVGNEMRSWQEALTEYIPIIDKQ